jgi:hypothetical protein
VFLSSDDASNVVGADLTVDGGDSAGLTMHIAVARHLSGKDLCAAAVRVLSS